MLERQQALINKGALTDGEIKSLVKDWHNRRTEEVLNQESVKIELNKIQRGATGGHTIGKGGWPIEGVGQSNGGLRKHGDSRN